MIAHYARVLRYPDHLIPLTAKQYEKINKKYVVARGVHAIKLINTAPNAKIRIHKKDFVVSSNGRNFVYWGLNIRQYNKSDNTEKYLKMAEQLARKIPEFKKFKNRTRLKPHEKRRIARFIHEQPPSPEETELNERSQRLLKEAAAKAFSGSFIVEQIAELAKTAFKKLKVIRIYLWSETGRVGEGFRSFDSFVQWLWESYSQYRNVEQWNNGIAIQIS